MNPVVLTPHGVPTLPYDGQRDRARPSGCALPGIFQAGMEVGSRWEEWELAQGSFDSG